MALARPLSATLASCLIWPACTTVPQYSGDVALRNVNVVSMVSEEILPNQTVIVADGEIVAIQPTNEATRISADTIIDCDGGYLIPGLADMHTHLGLILPWDGEPSVDGMESDLSLYLPNGVTTIRNMRATPGILDLRAKLDGGDLIGPRLIASGPSLHSELPDSFGPKITSRTQSEEEIARQKLAGYDFVKVHQELALFVEAGISPYDALKAATVNPAKWAGREGKEGIIVVGAKADMVLLAANPLVNIDASEDVKGVMRSGVWIDRESLDEMLRVRLGE